MTPTAKDIGSALKRPDTDRIFRKRGEEEYSLEILPIGILFYVARLRRSSSELHGELSVTLTNGHFPHARTIGNGSLSSVDLNFSSSSARIKRAKELMERSGAEGQALDWVGFVEELSVKTILAERAGEPGMVLADFPKRKDDKESYEFDGFPVLKRHPTVLFGKGASGKSYLAMWIAGQLSLQGVPVAYLDWELAGEDHAERLNRLFQPAPRTVHYLHCRKPLREDMDRVKAFIHDNKCQFGVFDSVGPASRAGGGRFQDGDLGQEYFGLVRRLGLGSLHVAHPPKRTDDEKDATIYGSAFFDYLARSVWFVQAADNPPRGQVLMGLYHHKLTTGPKLSPRAYRLLFEGDRTKIEATDLKAIDELAAKLPLLERIEQKLSRGSSTVKNLAAELDVNQAAIRKTILRHSSKFTRLDKNTVALAARAEDLF